MDADDMTRSKETLDSVSYIVKIDTLILKEAQGRMLWPRYLCAVSRVWRRSMTFEVVYVASLWAVCGHRR